VNADCAVTFTTCGTLWLAVGHEGPGITTAPATDRLLAMQLTGATLPFDAAPYGMQRFLAAA
jgi:glycine/D-amino acid oxidase-like deaminating enzyme